MDALEIHRRGAAVFMVTFIESASLNRAHCCLRVRNYESKFTKSDLKCQSVSFLIIRFVNGIPNANVKFIQKYYSLRFAFRNPTQSYNSLLPRIREGIPRNVTFSSLII